MEIARRSAATTDRREGGRRLRDMHREERQAAHASLRISAVESLAPAQFQIDVEPAENAAAA
ncbi:MAG: hypothetical protein IPI67_37175 [Myxococcales bacterium]|nr:hypothetical protein [Myxococcales bacterium]